MLTKMSRKLRNFGISELRDYIPKTFKHLQGKCKWNTFNPGTQAAGSFNPAVLDAKSYWGPKYKTHKVGISERGFFGIYMAWKHGLKKVGGTGLLRYMAGFVLRQENFDFVTTLRTVKHFI